MTATLPPTRTPDQAFDLLSGYRAMLSAAGYHQTRVDTFTSSDGSKDVRFGYSGGEWRITTTVDHGSVARGTPPWTIKIDWRYPLPTMEQLMQHTVERQAPDGSWRLSATREMCLRGAE